MSNVRVCKRCSKLYLPIGATKYCNECLDELDKTVVTARDYLRENRSLSIRDLAVAIEASEKDLLLLVKDNRLVLDGANQHLAGQVFKCHMCGKPAVHGQRLCEACQKKMSGVRESLEQTVQREQEQKRVRMRTYNSDGKPRGRE